MMTWMKMTPRGVQINEMRVKCVVQGKASITLCWTMVTVKDQET
jgi:hypothetical protein